MQRLQVELINRLGGDEPHCWTLHRLSNRLGVAKIVLLALRIRADVFRRHESSIVSKHPQLATEMMRADASLHADETRRQIGEPPFHLPA